MKKTLLLGAAALAALTVGAQRLDYGYIQWPSSNDLATYITQWSGGNGAITIDSQQWEDENFFTSRVKPRTRFYNNASQVYPNITQYDATTNPNGNDKRHIWWVPIGNSAEGKYHTNALPDATLDGEVFSMWSYLDHYGDWTAPWGWVPGAFADAAHKNGVAVSGVASVPYGGLSESWGNSFRAIGNVNATEVAKFLYAHGVDGLGYNSEFSTSSATVNILKNLHETIKSYMLDKNPIYENVWYAGTNDNGSINFDSGISAFTGLYNSAAMFLNYNWNNPSTMASAIQLSKNMRRSPFYIYAGMNQQGGEPRSGENYPMLKDYQYSIGVWGAHNFNMLWQSRNDKGSSHDVMQRTYIDYCEQWFTNGPRNPAIKKAITTNRAHRPHKNWAGLSSMMSERSVLSWDITSEPFITYFNLGNGTFFNIKGQRQATQPWYNIGMQDYLPTWRWWFAPTFMQRDVEEGTTHLSADFVWSDAYFGGSSLQIAGTTASEYLHLFKTSYAIPTNAKFSITYKLLEGEADIDLVYGLKDSETTELSHTRWSMPVLTVADSDAAIDYGYAREGNGGWITKTWNINSTARNALSGKNIEVIALRIKNAKNLKVLLGGFSIMPGANASTPKAFPTPAQPTITNLRLIHSTYTGIDGKLVWNMPNSKGVGEPVYNSDVNTSYFKVYAQEEDGEPQFMCTTTSWAAIAFRAPNTSDDKRIRLGVSAVAIDHASESDISWSEYVSKPAYVASNDIELTKTTIKPGEPFAIRYIDAKHTSSNWRLYNNQQQKVAEADGVAIDLTAGLSEIGAYTLKIDEGTTSERTFGDYVQISSESIGALPQIYTISRQGSTVSEGDAAVQIQLTDRQDLSYTGRRADGNASRAIAFNQKYVGCNVGALGIQGGQSFSVAGWFKFDKLPDKNAATFRVSNRAGAWPNSNWGWCWCFVEPDGTLHNRFRSASSGSIKGELHYLYPDYKLVTDAWTHIAYVMEYQDGGFRLIYYVNGEPVPARWTRFKSGNSGEAEIQGSTFEFCPNQNWAIAATDDLYLCGTEYQGSAIDGIIDDFQVWNKAMTQDEVKQSMAGFTAGGTLPSGLLCLWDFEDDPSEDLSFPSKGSKPDVKGFAFDFISPEDAKEGQGVIEYNEPLFMSGCPFLSGTAFPVVTKAQWRDTDRKTQFVDTKADALTEGESGSATVSFANPGDHNVTLTLSNSYGTDSRTFPTFVIQGDAAIGAVDADNTEGIEAYTLEDILFVQFAQEGDYTVEVYNAAGITAGHAQLTAAAGQSAQITLGAPGIYVVRVSNVQGVLRTIKVMRK